MEELLPAEATPETPKPTLRRLFYGDDGLRAGWSFLIFLVLVFAFGAAINFVIAHFHLVPKPNPKAPIKPLSPRSTVLSDGFGFAVLTVAAAIMSLIERRPFTRYGIAVKRALPDFLIGVCWGFFFLSLLVGSLWLTHSIQFDGLAIHGTVAAIYAAKWFLGFLCVGLTEEFFTRGYIQYTVSRGAAGIVRALDSSNRHAHAWGFWVSAGIFSIGLFMLAHIFNPGETLVGILQVGIVGAVFSFSLYRTGSLWWAIGFHASWDWAQSYFYGTRDSGLLSVGHLFNSHPTGSEILSGGSTGPEGSVLGIPLFLLVALVIHLTLPRREYFLTPDQTPPAVEQPS
jgi:membrane protease YdiL (CAAX protease family)